MNVNSFDGNCWVKNATKMELKTNRFISATLDS